jgi:predicted ATP-grasp superfamily ATP-dependent carboligase
MHHGALGAVRSAGRLRIPVYCAHTAERSFVDSSRYSRGALTIPIDATRAQVIDLLMEFGHERHGAVLLPVDDASAVFLDEQRATFEQPFIFPRPPTGLTRRLVNKRELTTLCEAHDIQTPTSIFPDSESEAIEHVRQLEFPVVVKRIDRSAIGVPCEDIGGETVADGHPGPRSELGPNVWIARDHEELRIAYRRMDGPSRPNVMLQEYIPDGHSNWMFNGYFDSRSELNVAFTGRKIRQSPTHGGAATLGMSERNAVIGEISKRFMSALGYRGIVDIDYRFDRRDGSYKLLDVNPRIGSTFRLFVAGDGTDVLRAMYLDLTGQEVSRAAQCERRRWLVELQDLRASLTQFRQGDLTVREWLSSVRHVDEMAWWARDDPWPVLALSRAMLADRASRRVDRWRNGSQDGDGAKT